jgi:hypothetical protein
MVMKRIPFLSKSKFGAGVQCLKRLYWQVYQPDLAAETDDQAQFIMDQGKAVGVEAQKAFPGGVLVEADHQHPPRGLGGNRPAYDQPAGAGGV